MGHALIHCEQLLAFKLGAWVYRRCMNANSSRAHDSRLQTLTAAELDDFGLVVANAKSMGWLTAQQSLSAARCASSVVVRDLTANVIRERRYEDEARWLYQLLHDLSQGLWKIKPACRSPCVTDRC
jgi:hypothetical protein